MECYGATVFFVSQTTTAECNILKSHPQGTEHQEEADWDKELKTWGEDLKKLEIFILGKGKQNSNIEILKKQSYGLKTDSSVLLQQ